MWLVGLLSTLQPLATDLYLPTLPALAASFDADVATAQLTLSLFVAAFGVWQLVAGPLSDRFGRQPVIVGGALTYLAASLLCAAAPSIDVLIIGRMLQAVGACSCLVGARGLVRDLYPPSEGARLLAAASTIMSVAPLTGPVVGAYLHAWFGWRSSFVLLALVSASLVAVLLRWLRETNERRNPHALAPRPMLQSYRDVLRQPAFHAYTLTASATYACLFAFLAGGSFVLIRVLGLTPLQVGLAQSVMVAGYLVGTLLCRRLIAVRGMQATLRLGGAVQAAAGLLMAGCALAGLHHAAAIIVPMIFIGLSHGMLQPAAQSGAVAPFPHSAGAAAALLGFLMMCAAALVGAWIGHSYNGTVYPLTLTMAALAMVTFASAWLLVGRHGDLSAYG
jgi:DHA1 family bicyclomycin/chloramphenicol resistance-like MFS transporter